MAQIDLGYFLSLSTRSNRSKLGCHGAKAWHPHVQLRAWLRCMPTCLQRTLMYVINHTKLKRRTPSFSIVSSWFGYLARRAVSTRESSHERATGGRSQGGAREQLPGFTVDPLCDGSTNYDPPCSPYPHQPASDACKSMHMEFCNRKKRAWCAPP